MAPTPPLQMDVPLMLVGILILVFSQSLLQIPLAIIIDANLNVPSDKPLWVPLGVPLGILLFAPLRSP